MYQAQNLLALNKKMCASHEKQTANSSFGWSISCIEPVLFFIIIKKYGLSNYQALWNSVHTPEISYVDKAAKGTTSGSAKLP